MADLSDLAQLPAITKFIERCTVTAIPAGAAPKDVTIQLPDADGAKVPARYTGFPPGLAVNDVVSVRATPQDTIRYVIAGTSGATAPISSGWPFDNIRSVDPANIFADDANLPDAVTNATAGDVVILNPGTYTLAAILDIDKSLTIDGVDPTRVTIQYSGADHTIDINAADITLKNLTIINTSATASTAPVVANGTDFVIENCILTSSGHAASNGVYSLGSSGKIVDSVVTASGASSVGIKDASATFTVSVIHCTVTGVNADISLSVAGSSVDIQDSTMTNGEINTTSTSTLTGTLNGTMLVNNASGGIPAQGNVGYLDEAGDYIETTDEGDNVAWCIVEIGNVDGKNIFVRRRGETTVNVTTSPSAGHFLITSTTAGSATHSETMRPEIFAVCTAGESGGTVAVQLLTGSVPVIKSEAQFLYAVGSHGGTLFTGTVNAGPAVPGVSTTFTYTLSTGNEAVLKPSLTTQLAKMRICNTTQSPDEYALITDVNTGTNTITVTDAADISAWVNADVLTIQSELNKGSLSGNVYIDLEFTSGLPALARGFDVFIQISDTGAAGQPVTLHPWVAFSASKLVALRTQVSSLTNDTSTVFMPVIDNRITFVSVASGAATKSDTLKLFTIMVAAP